MAENTPGENGAQSGDAGHRTIKLTPMNVQTPSAEEGGDTSTVKVSRASLKPKIPVPPAAASGDLEKTQAIPLKSVKPVASAEPVSSPFMKKLVPGNTTQAITPKPPDTATKGIPLSGVASVPKPETEDIDQTSTVRLNRPAPKPMSTHSAPISTKSTPIPQSAKKPLVAPLGAKPPEADAAPTVKIGIPQPAPIPVPPTATGGIRVGTSTTGIKLNSIPAKKINLGAPVGTSTTGIKIGTATTGIKVGTATTGIKLGAKPVIPGAATVKLAPPSTEPPAEEVATSTQAIKIDGVPTPGASTVKLKAPVVPAASVVPPSLDKVEEVPVEEPAGEPVAEEPAAEEPAAEETAAEEAVALEEPAAEEVAVEEVAADGKKKKKAKAPKVKKPSVPGANPHWLFTVSSCVAMICLILWAILLTVQFLNQWQGMDIQLPGLQFLSLGK